MLSVPWVDQYWELHLVSDLRLQKNGKKTKLTATTIIPFEPNRVGASTFQWNGQDTRFRCAIPICGHKSNQLCYAVDNNVCISLSAVSIRVVNPYTGGRVDCATYSWECQSPCGRATDVTNLRCTWATSTWNCPSSVGKNLRRGLRFRRRFRWACWICPCLSIYDPIHLVFLLLLMSWTPSIPFRGHTKVADVPEMVIGNQMYVDEDRSVEIHLSPMYLNYISNHLNHQTPAEG